MNGKAHKARRRSTMLRTTATVTALALFGLTASGRAEPTELAIAASSLTQPSGPVFVPGADPRFAEAFAEFETPAEPVALEGAVDITTVEPAASPAEAATRDLGTGIASYYGRGFAGRPTANGERFDPRAMTAAHRTLPFGSRVRVTNPRTGASVVVRINDRGPFTRGRTIDLSQGAAEQIGLIAAGHGNVQLELIAG